MSNQIQHSTHPLNAEPPPSSLLTDRITPTPLLYHRNHGGFPEDAKRALETEQGGSDDWEVLIKLDEAKSNIHGSTDVVVKMGQIKSSMPYVQEEIALQVSDQNLYGRIMSCPFVSQLMLYSIFLSRSQSPYTLSVQAIADLSSPTLLLPLPQKDSLGLPVQ